MRLSAQLDYEVVAVDVGDEVTALVEIAAPEPPPDVERAPSTLQVVLDRSGSMGGGRLAGAKRALLALVDRLDPSDSFGLVSFSNEARVEIPTGPLHDKHAARVAIRGLRTTGCTDVSSGLLRGIQQARHASADTGATLLLISDGHANQGVTEHDALRGCARNAYEHGVTVSTLGYGLGYDEQLLGAIADGGAGSALFAEDPDAAGTLIAGEVEGLLAKVAQAASLTVRPCEPVTSADAVGDLPTHRAPDGTLTVELGDFYGGETRKMLLRFAVPRMAALGPAVVAELEFTHVAVPDLRSETVLVPVSVNVVPGDDAQGRVPDPTVRTELAVTEAQSAKREASAALRRGDGEHAAELLTAAGHTLDDQLATAPADQADEVRREADELRGLAESARTDDARRSAKRNYASWHGSTRKRGRQARS